MKTMSTAQRVMCYVLATEDHGATADDVEAKLGLSHQQASARFSELVAAKCFVANGQRRKTRFGGMADVYVVRAGANFDIDYRRTRNQPRAEARVMSEMDVAIADTVARFSNTWWSKGPMERRKATGDLIAKLVEITRPKARSAA